jgi:hypothetical protein
LGGAGIAIERLRTPHGELSYALRRDERHLVLRVEAGARPPAGFVLPWPLDGTPGVTRVNGQRTRWHDGELRIASAPATITIDLGKD